MSVNSIQEILIHFHTYKNIDLINQGLYQIKASVSMNYMNKTLYAVPYYFTESKDLETLSMTDENEIKPHSVISASVCDNGYEYKTKSFVIRYADEEVELDEFCYFRIEVPSKVNLKDIVFNCNFSLEFSDVLSSQGKDLKNGIFQNIKFKLIQTSKVTLYNSKEEPYSETFSPIVYKDSFSSLLNVSVHKLLVDYKPRIDPNIFPFTLEEDTITSTNPNDPNAKKESKLSKKDVTAAAKKTDKANSNFTLINIFLAGLEVPNFLGKKTIDELYSKFVISLVESYLAIKVKLSDLVFRLIDENNKAEYASFLNLQPLVIYSEEKDENILISEDNIASTISNLKNFSARISDYSKEYIGFRIFQEISFISSQICFIWHKYIELIRTFPGPSNFIFSVEFKKKLQNELFKFLKKSVITIPDTSNLLIPIDARIQEHNNQMASDIRKKLVTSYKRPIIENENFKISPASFPILFEETYVKNLIKTDNPTMKSKEIKKGTLNKTNPIPQSNFYIDPKDMNNLLNLPSASQSGDFKFENSLGLHLIVLVHGFQGNSNDMRLIKNEIALLNPSCVFLSSIANQDDTEIDFFEMGKKLAKEIKSYIKEWTDGLIFNKLSFIGHSIGGVIIRSALPHLEEYKSKFWLYISLSSPHMGYAFSESKIINAGMWVLKKWKGAKSLEQLMLDDNKNFRETCLFKISEYEGLNWFKYVYFLSSHQDYYAPYESTRIQLSSKTMESDQKAEAYRTMAYNILSKLTNNTLKRVDVNFVIQEKNLDSFIGRTAHIQFLENTDFMKIFFHNIEELFN